jgi:hypothetical protein
MTRGAILDEAFIQSLGLGDQLLTLSGPIENRHHPLVHEALFHLSTQEVAETIYLERKYVFEHQVSIKSSYGKGDRILAWLHRVMVPPVPGTGSSERVDLLMVRELFMLGEWREFHRFKSFVKSMRIQDAQSRGWLAEHHRDFPGMVDDPKLAIRRILDCLNSCAEWPDLENAVTHPDSLEQLAKTYSKGLAPIRASPLLPGSSSTMRRISVSACSACSASSRTPSWARRRWCASSARSARRPATRRSGPPPRCRAPAAS